MKKIIVMDKMIYLKPRKKLIEFLTRFIIHDLKNNTVVNIGELLFCDFNPFHGKMMNALVDYRGSITKRQYGQLLNDIIDNLSDYYKPRNRKGNHMLTKILTDRKKVLWSTYLDSNILPNMFGFHTSQIFHANLSCIAEGKVVDIRKILSSDEVIVYDSMTRKEYTFQRTNCRVERYMISRINKLFTGFEEKRGGARKNAGRPKSDTKRIVVQPTLPKEMATTIKESGEMSNIIEECLEDYLNPKITRNPTAIDEVINNIGKKHKLHEVDWWQHDRLRSFLSEIKSKVKSIEI